MVDPSTRRTGIAIFALCTAVVCAPGAGSAANVSCSIPQPCALYANAGGPGFEGSTTYPATTTASSTYGLEGVDSNTNGKPYNIGVFGSSKYGTGVRGYGPASIGVSAASSSGTGLSATSGTGTAIVGSSVSANGIVGKTAATNASTTHYAVMGDDVSTNGGSNVGVYGTTTNGGYGVLGVSGNEALGAILGIATSSIGVRGQSSSSFGVYGSSGSGIGSYGSGSIGGAEGSSGSGYGVYGASASGTGVVANSSSGSALTATSTSGNGIVVQTSGGGGAVGAYVSNGNGNGTDITGSYIGLLGRSDTYPLTLTDSAGSNLMFVDGSGNVYTHGTYRTFVATRDGGATSTAFTTRSTAPNVEDVGSARLTNGSATVAFDPAFVASIDAHATYRVFLTPSGDTRGLYIAAKTPAGFVVRETQGGRGTLDFDYRVVAAVPGRARERMALVGPSGSVVPKAPLVRPHVSMPRTLATPTANRHAIR